MALGGEGLPKNRVEFDKIKEGKKEEKKKKGDKRKVGWGGKNKKKDRGKGLKGENFVYLCMNIYYGTIINQNTFDYKSRESF